MGIYSVFPAMRTNKLYSFVQATQKQIIKADAYVAGLWFNIVSFFSFTYCWINSNKTFFVIAACDVPGIKRLLPKNWRESQFFDNIYQLVGVPVVTVQLRYNGWVTELRDLERSR